MAFLSTEHSLARVGAGYHLDLVLFSLCQMLCVAGEFVLTLAQALPSAEGLYSFESDLKAEVFFKKKQQHNSAIRTPEHHLVFYIHLANPPRGTGEGLKYYFRVVLIK